MFTETLERFEDEVIDRIAAERRRNELNALDAACTPLAEPLALTEVDVSTPQKLAARLFGIVPMFVLLGAFIGLDPGSYQLRLTLPGRGIFESPIELPDRARKAVLVTAPALRLDRIHDGESGTPENLGIKRDR